MRTTGKVVLWHLHKLTFVCTYIHIYTYELENISTYTILERGIDDTSLTSIGWENGTCVSLTNTGYMKTVRPSSLTY